MDSFENQTPSAPQGELNQLREQYESLRQLVTSLLILMIMISGAFFLFAYRQYKWVHSELVAVRPGATQMIAEYQKKNGPAMDDIVKKIRDYGRTHPDFDPIMKKYSLDQLPPDAPPAPKK